MGSEVKVMKKKEFLQRAADGLLSTGELARGFAEHYLMHGMSGPEFCKDVCLIGSAADAYRIGERLVEVFRMWAGHENAPADCGIRQRGTGNMTI